MPATGQQPDLRYKASGECWHTYCELSAYSLGRGYSEFIHQHVVDAYGAQHIIGTASNIGIAFSLIGLYLAVEKGFSGRAVQRAHMRLARAKKRWPKFESPRERARLTVLDVMQAEAGQPRDEMIVLWAAAIWRTWSEAHEWARETCEQLLDVERVHAEHVREL